MLNNEGWKWPGPARSPASSEEIAIQIARFRSKEGFERQQARRRLTDIGRSAVPALIEALTDQNEYVRWEAARTLKDIPDESAAGALVTTLRDEVPGVRWLAAEALIELGEASLIPLLHGLMKHFQLVFFRESAYHVLHSFEREKILHETLIHVLDALRTIQPVEIIPLGAYKALEWLSGNKAWTGKRGESADGE
jgi:hypothetical protein